MSDAPEGFSPLFRTSPFLDALGPFYHRREGRALIIGVPSPRSTATRAAPLTAVCS